jgi:aspartate/methionine/tyrosine aminotransferase
MTGWRIGFGAGPQTLTNALTLTPPEFDRQVGEVIQRGTHEALAKYQRLAGKG